MPDPRILSASDTIFGVVTAWPPITRDDLELTAKRDGFPTKFPLLVRRLILETGGGITHLDMPGGSGVASGGFDGIVTATEATPFVPEGTSVWELSVGGGQRKADDDYGKRLTGPDGVPTKQVTYVQAILEPWTKARSWTAERNQDGRWREVRGYNLDRIHAWLDQAPATTVWLAGQIGKAMSGVRSLEDWWSESWLPSTRVPLDEAVVLAGREEAADELVTLIESGSPVISIGGDIRPDEAMAFVAAAIARSTSLDIRSIGARALHVSDENSLAQLVTQAQPLVLLLSDPGLARHLPAKHSHQLLLLSPPGAQKAIKVPRLDPRSVQTHFEAKGLSRDEAAKLATLGRRSLLALRRVLALHPELFTPKWSIAPSPVQRRLLLVGRWSFNNQADRDVVRKLVGRSYHEVEEEASRLQQGDDVPFMRRVEDIWCVLAAEDAWTLLASALTPDDLEAYRTAVLDVLTELGPVLELPPSDRWRAGLTGVGMRHSSTLRKELARSLIYLAVTKTPVQGLPGYTTADFSCQVVREVFERANSDSTNRLWSSLVDLLSLLAEAAPEEFMQGLRIWLSKVKDVSSLLFTDNDKDDRLDFGGNSPHTRFLWALETIAWSPDYIDEAVDLLAALASVDPGGRLANRPLASLVGILSAWCPNTTAGIDDRLRCIKRVVRKHPDLGRRLLLELIPDGHSVQTEHPGPELRDWKTKQKISWDELKRVVNEVVSLLIELLDADPSFYPDIIPKIANFSPEHRAVIAERIAAIGKTDLADADRSRIYDPLREEIAQHREYADAAWALPGDELDLLQQAVDAVAPRDPVSRNAWLFREHWVTLGDLRKRDNFEAYNRELDARRAEAVGEVLKEQGLNGLSRLAERTSQSGLVGSSLACRTGDYDEVMLDWVVGSEERSQIATGYLARRMREEGGDLRDRLLDLTQDPVAQARILRLSGDPSRAWEKLADLDPQVSEHYWREFSYLGLGHDFSHVTEAARSLLDAGRPSAALDLIVLYSHNDLPGVEAAQVAASALEMLLDVGLDDSEFKALSRYDLKRVFTLLSKHRDEIGLQRVVTLEWHLFPLVGLKDDAPTLHRAVVEDPRFFVELLTALPGFENRKSDNTSRQTEEQRRAFSLRAYRVLDTCGRCPGVTEDRRVDASALKSWVDVAREQLASLGQLKRGDLRIGELLSHAPPASDGAPLHEAVRDLIEELQSDEIDRGIWNGICKSRGVTMRGLTDGGKMEWELVRAYQEYAQQARGWPRTRRLFNQLADFYEKKARREDAEAELIQQGFDW